jgi:hypothetical protein
MTKPPPISSIKLTRAQIDALRPYFDRVQATAAMGSPGMLVAQLRAAMDGESGYVMVPAFLEHEHAKLITQKGRTLGIELAKASKDEPE